MDRKKELKELYKNIKPDMGIIMVNSNINNKCYIEVTQDLKSTINGTKFKLNSGNFYNSELQKEWKEFGEESFSIDILEILKYDKEDESKKDYSEDLAILKMIWEEKLSNQGMEIYEK